MINELVVAIETKGGFTVTHMVKRRVHCDLLGHMVEGRLHCDLRFERVASLLRPWEASL
mgnify:CR=1 FL=1